NAVLSEQPLADAGRWSQLNAGSTLGQLEALFPRIETEIAEAK
ncbi:MAG: hypothetical protein RI931_49, partial [Actinomycetota bacterium]